jgi:hypothetical protein
MKFNIVKYEYYSVISKLSRKHLHSKIQIGHRKNITVKTKNALCHQNCTSHSTFHHDQEKIEHKSNLHCKIKFYQQNQDGMCNQTCTKLQTIQ